MPKIGSHKKQKNEGKSQTLEYEKDDQSMDYAKTGKRDKKDKSSGKRSKRSNNYS